MGQTVTKLHYYYYLYFPLSPYIHFIHIKTRLLYGWPIKQVLFHATLYKIYKYMKNVEKDQTIKIGDKQCDKINEKPIEWIFRWLLHHQWPTTCVSNKIDYELPGAGKYNWKEFEIKRLTQNYWHYMEKYFFSCFSR